MKIVAFDLLQHTLPPALLAQIDLDSIEPCSEILVDEQLQLHMVDVVYKARFNNQAGYIIQLIEHQSTVDPLMAFRLLLYSFKLMDKHLQQSQQKMLPLVYVTVLYNGESHYYASTDFFELFGNNEALARSL